MFRVFRYQQENGSEPFTQWVTSLKDRQARARIDMRITRIETGNLGDCKHLKEGVYELRIDHGPGYRVYFGMIGKTAVLLLAGGDKRKQTADIERAMSYLQDFKRRQK